MIHRYQKKGLNFVLDVNSGAVHLLDDISYAVSGLLDENMLIPVRRASLTPCRTTPRTRSARHMTSCTS